MQAPWLGVAPARLTSPGGLGFGKGCGCTGCRKVSFGGPPGARRPHGACSERRGRGSSSRPAPPPSRPRPARLRAAGCRSGRAGERGEYSSPRRLLLWSPQPSPASRDRRRAAERPARHKRPGRRARAARRPFTLCLACAHVTWKTKEVKTGRPT